MRRALSLALLPLAIAAPPVRAEERAAEVNIPAGTAGDAIRATRATLGGSAVKGDVGIGIGVCEDFWHPTLPAILAQDGAELLVNVAAGPARGASVDAD